MSGVVFSVDEVTEEMESSSDFKLISEGAHNFVVESARIADNKKGTGQFLEIVLRIEGGKQKVWHYFNCWNTNENACKIAKVDLKKFALAVGLQKIIPEHLEGLVVVGVVEHERDIYGKLKAKITEWLKAEVAF
jgi:hypothetical protein